MKTTFLLLILCLVGCDLHDSERFQLIKCPKPELPSVQCMFDTASGGIYINFGTDAGWIQTHRSMPLARRIYE